jgi:DNA polymerase I-like protein with 3'-5' exonuclease and polymerase domains
MPIFKTLKEFDSQYETPLARAMFHISKRGILIDQQRLGALRTYIEAELQAACLDISQRIGRIAVPNAKAEKIVKKSGQPVINIGSDDQLKNLLREMGMKVPHNHKTGKETTSEDAIYKLYASTGNQVLDRVLRIGELNHMLSNDVNATLLNDVYLSDYVTTGTVTGRRSSRANVFGYGGNGQNKSKHTALGKMYRHCMVARPGRIFLSCDQASAEDWVVWAIIADQSGDTTGLKDLAVPGRHRRLASFLFAKPESECTKDTMAYYLGKKTRHANNYGTRGATMSAALAGERVLIAPKECQTLLDRANAKEPQIQNVFQKYIINELASKRELRTPIGRRRYFLDLRDYGDNAATFRNGFAYIPQSTVGDNTGLAILAEEAKAGTGKTGEVVGDHHDAVLEETRQLAVDIRKGISSLTMAFDRTLEFTGGFTLKVPIEFEVGFDLKNMFTVTLDNVDEVLEKCHAASERIGSRSIVTLSPPLSQAPSTTCGGVQSPQSVPA